MRDSATREGEYAIALTAALVARKLHVVAAAGVVGEDVKCVPVRAGGRRGVEAERPCIGCVMQMKG